MRASKGLLIVILIFLFFTFSGCGLKNQNAKEGFNQNKPVAVEVLNIQRTKIEEIKILNGKTKPVNEVSIVSKIPGKVKKVLVDVGKKVNKGEVLFILEDDDIRRQLRQAETALNAAKANLERAKGGSLELQMKQLESALATAKSNLDDAKQNYENMKALYKAGGVSKQVLDSAELRFKLAQEQYNTSKAAKELTESRINPENIMVLEAQVKQAKASYDLAKSQLENIVVTSPINGIVSSCNIDVGEFVSNTVPMITVVDISSIIVDINVTEDMITNIRVGDKYEVNVAAASSKPFVGEVISVSPNVEMRTQLYPVRIKILNPDGNIKGGMSAEVKIKTRVKENVLAVPIDAIVDENGEKVIYIVNGDRAVRKQVKTGISDHRFVEIIGNVAEGDKVIVKGQNFVEDKSKVIIGN